MPWYMPIVPESIKKRVCIYLLQRYLGQFFEEKLTLDQLSVDLYNGTGTVEKVSLDVQALNELGEKQNWPMEFVDGYLDKLFIRVPWSALLKESSYIEVEGLHLTVQPKQRNESATSMFESMWSSSMTNSMQLAQECMKQDVSNSADTAQPLEAIERFAQTIESILCKVKVKFINTVIQLEHVPKNSNTGVALRINIAEMQYLDEAGEDPPTSETTDLNNQQQNKTYIVSSFTTKNFFLQGVTFSTVEFPSNARTFSRSLMTQSQTSNAYEKEKDDSLVTTFLENENVCDDDVKKVAAEDRDCLSNLDEQRHVVLFGKLSKRQEIRVRLKQSENVTGPKVSIEVNLGSLTLFLSPRQVHVLLELASGLASPDMEDTSNVAPRQKCTEKPMSGLDYQRVEQELQQQLHPLNTFQAGGLQGAHGWSTAALEESDSEENFLPMKSASSGGMYDSAMSGISSSMESSLSSSITSSITDTSSRTRRRVCNIDTDPTAEISHFQIRFASLAAVILHEDLLTLSTDHEQTLILSSVKQMQATADAFFEKLGHFAVTGYGNKDFDGAKEAFERACNLNHLRLLAAPLQIEGSETTTSTAFSIKGELTAAKLELLECLNQMGEGFEYVPLLSFPDVAQAQTGSPLIPKPSLKMHLKHVERTVKTGIARRGSIPKTDICVTLNNCTAEVDITIIDRICALLNPQPVCVVDKPANNPWITSTNYNTTQTETRLDLKITSPYLTLKLRFPIPDFRPPHDMSKTPWWKRHVRADFLTVNMSDMTAQSSYQTNQSFQKYVLQCRSLHVNYYETENSTPLPIAKTGVDEKYGSSMQDVFNHSRLVLQIHPMRKFEVELDQMHDADVDPMTQSVYGALGSQTSKQPGPFSAKRVVHESDTPHANPQQEDSEELIIPGDKQEINDFIELTTQSARVQIEVSLPTVTMQLVSKHVYELIYNRINNDLLLWEPSAPKPKAFEKPYYSGYGNFVSEPQDFFTMCKSGIQYESESDSDVQSDPEDDGIFYSTYDRMKQSQKHTVTSTELRGQSLLALSLNIGHGLLCWNPPVRDVASNVIPSQHGEFFLNVEDASIFVVNGYQGDENLGFVCVQAHAAQLHHCDMISTPSQSPPLKEFGSIIGRHLHPTVYKSEQGMLANCNNRGGDREMFTVAVKVQANHETHHVKTVRVAVGINKATLRHRMCNEPNSWISQLADFFNVTDYPIPGYHPKDVLTELHLHLWDCAIDYRPHNLPLRSAVTFGNFTMSSHLSAQANTSTLRFIAEECALFISEKAPPRSGTPSSSPVDLKRDYVSVIDVGLFELSLKTNDKKCGINPHIDLRASNNVVHIRTCADSAKALTQLLTYFASDGDLVSNESSVHSGSAFSSPRHQPEVELVSVEPQDISNLSVSQHQHVNELLGEAMKECTSSGDENTPDVKSSGAKIFFFPDENNSSAAQDTGKPLPQVTYELGDVTYRSNKGSDTDDDFCFVGDEAGLGILPKNGLPEIRWLTEEPIRIIENHFSVPVGKTDLLKTPKDFPVPVMRYTLCDMSIIWHIYGGNDFKTADKEEKPKKTVNFSDMRICEEVGFSNTRTGEVIFTNFMEKKKQKVSWQTKGGVNRNQDVLIELQLNKVRFQHEIYPENTREASRQVLLVSDLEIRDKLKSSQINKFLYQYTSQARPKQSHANMIVVKATHIRPDPKLKSQECILQVSLLPLRLNIDQDSLLFLITFFNELCGNSAKDGDEATPSKHSTPTHQPPVMTVSIIADDKEMVEQAEKMVGENLLILLEENKEAEEGDMSSPAISNTGEECPIYFRKVIFAPDVPIRLDYHGKRVDMTHGPLPGLLMGLGQLNCSELRLKRLSNRHGILGVDKLIAYVLQEWLNDIKKNQLPSLLGGVGPMYSLVQLFQGIRDLFWLPIEQYQKDGRIVRGLQRGANSFTTSTAMAALELTSRIIHLIQITAETAYDMLSPGPSVRRTLKTKGRRKRYGQPQDIREGMTNAYMVVKEGIGETAENIVRIASHEHEQKGYSGAVGGVLRQIPPTIFKPIIIASEATSNVLGGMRCQLVPDAKREANQKWKSDDS